jgi:hypothetical protein
MATYNLMKEGGKAAYLDTGTWAASGNKKEANFEKPLSLLLQQLKTTIIFQKDMQYLQMLIIFIARATIPFWYSNERVSCNKHTCCMRYEF